VCSGSHNDCLVSNDSVLSLMSWCNISIYPPGAAAPRHTTALANSLHALQPLKNTVAFLLFARTVEHSANEALLLHATCNRGDTAPVGPVGRVASCYTIVVLNKSGTVHKNRSLHTEEPRKLCSGQKGYHIVHPVIALLLIALVSRPNTFAAIYAV
jgi:hypothetical protein